MRIGHQIYNYLNDYTNDGQYTLLHPIEVIPNWPDNKEPSYIHEACIIWSEDQVYITVVTGEIPTYMNINSFLKWMGGPQKPQSYKPLYQLRDQLKFMAKKKYQNMKHIKSNTFTHYISLTKSFSIDQ